MTRIKIFFLSTLAFLSVVFVLLVLVPEKDHDGIFYAATFLVALSFSFLFFIPVFPDGKKGFDSALAGLGISIFFGFLLLLISIISFIFFLNDLPRLSLASDAIWVFCLGAYYVFGSISLSFISKISDNADFPSWTKVKVQELKTLLVKTNNSEDKKVLEKIIEQMKFANQKKYKSSAAIERQIDGKISELEMLLGNTEALLAQADKISKLVQERNLIVNTEFNRE